MEYRRIQKQGAVDRERRVHSPSILIVEDQLAVRTTIRDFLHAAFPEAVIRSAPDGATAAQLWKHAAPDVALLDVRLPDCNGFELTARLKAAHPQARVIVMSYWDHPRYAERATAAGARAFIPKDRLDVLLVDAMAAALRSYC